jgi:ParB family chromosome partitioning protein
MSKSERGMGRGLAAILSVSKDQAPAGDDLRELPVDLIAPSPNQPRRHFDEDALQALAGSLRERGVLQPVLVRPVAGGTYELVAGERRWRAARIAGLETVPALVRDRDDAQALEVALIENMARATRSRRRAPAPRWSRSSASRERTSACGSAAAASRSPT